MLAAPWIVDLYTPDDYPQSEFDLAVAFARLCLPQIFFYGLYAMLSQVLNSRGRFGAPMFAPIANNVVAIATFGLFIVVAGTSAAADGVLTTDQVLILGIGTTLGVMLQALILHPGACGAAGTCGGRASTGAAPGWARPAASPPGPSAWSSSTRSLHASSPAWPPRPTSTPATPSQVAAGLTTYQKAHLVFMLPHSVITVSIVTAMLPALSRVAHDGRPAQVGSDVARTMRVGRRR